MDKRMVDQEFHNEDTDLELSLRPTQLKAVYRSILYKSKSNLDKSLSIMSLFGPPGLGKTTLSNIIANEMDVNIRTISGPSLERPGDLAAILSGLFGPPGLGKTTLSNIIANEMDVNIRTISGPSLERPGDLAAILSGLQPGDVLFIDEIHRLSSVVEEVLYPWMRYHYCDVAEKKHSNRFATFTLVGATTRAGEFDGSVKRSFWCALRLEYYNENDLKEIITRTAEVLGTDIDKESALELARRSRGTPRIANRLLKRVETSNK